MQSLNTALLLNLLGFTVGIALYTLLGTMVVRHRKSSEGLATNTLLLMTSLLGLMWNAGELFVFLGSDHNRIGAWPFVSAVTYSALGFLPSVVVHSAWTDNKNRHWLVYAGYGVSIFAMLLHFWSAAYGLPTPSYLGLQSLTVAAIALAAGLLLFNFKQTLERKAVWATALLIFAVSTLHLSTERTEHTWIVELVSHQSSLPLALVILYQNYRFAFADLFLKRALALLLLSSSAFGIYVYAAAPLLRYYESNDLNDVQAVSLLLTFWIGTALFYPSILRFAAWFVDRVILNRSDYSDLQRSIAQDMEDSETIDEVLDKVSQQLARSLTSEESGWQESDRRKSSPLTDLVDPDREKVAIYIPTADLPSYTISLGKFLGGRRLLSDETAMVESIAMNVSRHIDAMRVTHERCERELREQEFSRLATEAQLTALRSQINPHFLFNALTTIGYLITTSPEKASQTLLQLTKLLRSVLSSASEFSTVLDEVKLIESYLNIEHSRFEERLNVVLNIDPQTEVVWIPSLILQPLVENAIKHGISENKAGGTVTISVRKEKSGKAGFLVLEVADTGAGSSGRINRRDPGTGLSNIKQRLQTYYQDKAEFKLDISTDATLATIRIPLQQIKEKGKAA